MKNSSLVSRSRAKWGLGSEGGGKERERSEGGGGGS